VRDILNDGWDFLIVAHPPCTRLCNRGLRWLHKAPPGKTVEQMWNDFARREPRCFPTCGLPLFPYLRLESRNAFSSEKANTELCRVFAERPAVAVRTAPSCLVAHTEEDVTATLASGLSGYLMTPS
jgi:hypothetical protein